MVSRALTHQYLSSLELRWKPVVELELELVELVEELELVKLELVELELVELVEELELVELELV